MFSSHRLFQNTKLLLQSCFTEMSRIISYRLVIISQFKNQGISLLWPTHLFTPFFFAGSGVKCSQISSLNKCSLTDAAMLSESGEVNEICAGLKFMFRQYMSAGRTDLDLRCVKKKRSITTLNKSATISLSFFVPVPKKES